ncbi:hypothetical protein [Bacteriovorax sp. Seq25_V]|uniref:hypothetical protein n=1 Tax=Bacteriovorax sp. Seq25_V TaxID=1201288 RepID=UPI00038A1576|nr:hypothetical protein [Bacteriovorax sp. Seq25_V]EQC43943.1 hypothetical protein M900_1502 [Bacteriovorax sp. Seq25_V]
MDAKAQQLLKKYMKNKKFLSIEPSVASKTAIETMLMKTAIPRKNIHHAKNLHMAMEIIKEKKPNYIITNERLEDGSYKEVLEEHLKQWPNRLESGFILLSENDSLDAISKVAQSEIDSLVIIPFTVTSLQSEFLKVVVPKTNPSDYEIALETIREHMRFDIDKAFTLAQKAVKLDPKPYEAYYLEGIIHLKSKALEQAKVSFEKSLKANSEYYNSLKELFAVYMTLKERHKAYQISKKLTEVFPVNPEMIPDLAWISVACAEYDDILKYHTAFKTVDQPDNDLKNYIAASLTIYGKKIMQDKYEKNETIDEEILNRAYKLMEEASVICEDKPLVFASLINTLRMTNNSALLENIFTRARKRFPNNKNIKVLEILIDDDKLKPAESLKNAQNAVKSGLDMPEIHEIILRRTVELGLPERIIEESLDNACKSFPNLKSVFEEILSSAKKD